jgi:hypothetical protein
VRNDDDECIASLPDDALLWTTVRTNKRSYLGGLRPPDFEFSSVVPLAEDVTDVVHDAATGAMYGLSDGALVRIDLQTGRLTDLLDDSAEPLGEALALDPDTRDGRGPARRRRGADGFRALHSGRCGARLRSDATHSARYRCGGGALRARSGKRAQALGRHPRRDGAGRPCHRRLAGSRVRAGRFAGAA